ncbi:hypothetical protein P879_03128 [Paragonimus westermani]|uniref:Vps16 C-terminal domain-containing protein n=1 Tax=Paragonimus westermani TaxID=34504 RepID=A0A8T0DNW7_9TREM|nr:hypothetical protein P879_03128 [Paragonimus westermani]
MMFDDTSWNDSEQQGFQFDWDKSEQLPNLTRLSSDGRFSTDAKLFIQADLSLEIERPVCMVCHSLIENNVFYESKVTFCSEHCWQSVLCTAMDDFAVGGMTAWPLETFTSFQAKMFLLNLACKSFDGGILIKMLRYFQTILTPDTFDRLLFANRIAFNHFAHFLRKTGQNSLLADLLMFGSNFTFLIALSCRSHGFVERAKIQSYRQLTSQLDSTSVENAENLVHRLRIFAMTELADDPKLSLLHETTLQLSDLLQFQLQREPEWKAFCATLSASSSEAQHSGDRSASLLALPLSETTRACCWMDKNVGAGSKVQQLCTKLKVLGEQFRWLVLEPLVLGANWVELDSILVEKKWFKRRTGTSLPTDRLVLYLHALNAPREIIAKYLSRCADPREMTEVAARLRMYSVAVQSCVNRRDPASMKELLERIPKKEPEHSEALYYLSIPVGKSMEKRQEKLNDCSVIIYVAVTQTCTINIIQIQHASLLPSFRARVSVGLQVPDTTDRVCVIQTSFSNSFDQCSHICPDRTEGEDSVRSVCPHIRSKNQCSQTGTERKQCFENHFARD